MPVLDTVRVFGVQDRPAGISLDPATGPDPLYEYHPMSKVGLLYIPQISK